MFINSAYETRFETFKQTNAFHCCKYTNNIINILFESGQTYLLNKQQQEHVVIRCSVVGTRANDLLKAKIALPEKEKPLLELVPPCLSAPALC